MADARKPDVRSSFFRNEASNRSRQKPRVTNRGHLGASYTNRGHLGPTNESLNNRGHLMGWSQRRNSASVNSQLHAAGYLSLQCMISYTKITEDFATRIWTVEPYSYRYRWLTSEGRWKPAILKKVFFGYDVEADKIKMFMYANIHDVTITRESFTPRWEVEIQQEEI